MILGNRTETPRAVFVGQSYEQVPPMGFIEIDDQHKDDVIAAIQPLLDAGVFVINKKPRDNERPVEVAGPTPPPELEAQPENPRVRRQKVRKTGETMKV